MPYGAKTDTTAAQLIAGARSGREQIGVQSLRASNLLDVGPHASVTAANRIRIAAGAERIIESRGDIYAIASAASTDVRFWEIYR